MNVNQKFMKQLKIYTLFALGALTVSCSEDDKLTVDIQDTALRGAILRTISVNPNSFINGEAESLWTVTWEEQDHEDGELLQSVDVYVGFFDDSPGNGTTTASEALLVSIPASDFSVGPNGLPRITYSISYGDALNALGLSLDPDVVTGSDQIIIRPEIVLTDGRTISDSDLSGTVSGGSFFSSPLNYRAIVVCPPKPPAAGIWTIEMEDSYGDGWQTDTAAGGSGITLTLDDGTVFEVGLCSPYAPSDFDCTPGDFSGTATITIPSGAETADWYFPGDTYGEISFRILTPSGNVVADVGAGTAAGPIEIDFCKD